MRGNVCLARATGQQVQIPVSLRELRSASRVLVKPWESLTLGIADQPGLFTPVLLLMLQDAEQVLELLWDSPSSLVNLGGGANTANNNTAIKGYPCG